jgi:hypothetical protein
VCRWTAARAVHQLIVMLHKASKIVTPFGLVNRQTPTSAAW